MAGAGPPHIPESTLRDLELDSLEPEARRKVARAPPVGAKPVVVWLRLVVAENLLQLRCPLVMQRRLATEHREPRVIREQGEDQRPFLPVEKAVEQVARRERGEIGVEDMDEHA